MAVLDENAARIMAGYPPLTGALVARALERTRRLEVNMAIIHQARVNIRLLMLLWHLADRWGRVRSEGVVLPLHLTHSVLADLVAARRPTVTSSLTDLARQELVEPQARGWLLRGEPPGELLELEPVEVVSAPEARGAT
jgi:CRP-like cAMP-binding protein